MSTPQFVQVSNEIASTLVTLDNIDITELSDRSSDEFAKLKRNLEAARDSADTLEQYRLEDK